MSAMRKPISLSRQTDTRFDSSDEDRRLFRETVGQVKPVTSDKVQPHMSRPKPFPRRGDREPMWAEIGSADVPLLRTGDIMSYVCFGLQKSVLRKLRQGHFGIDAEVDLHGYTVDQANSALDHFLRICLADRCRCVHVIHGKGYRSEGDRPILKNKINLWLRHHPEVLAFCTSKPRDGGTGAVYVLLRDRAKLGDSW
jgi:DNA-nicking Smr family endonuclease